MTGTRTAGGLGRLDRFAWRQSTRDEGSFGISTWPSAMAGTDGHGSQPTTSSAPCHQATTTSLAEGAEALLKTAQLN